MVGKNSSKALGQKTKENEKKKTTNNCKIASTSGKTFEKYCRWKRTSLEQKTKTKEIIMRHC